MALNQSHTETIVLFIIEVFSLCTSVAFLALFILRYKQLQKFSMTNRYKDFYPLFRIILSILFIMVSLTILIFSVVTSMYEYSWYNYILQGGGGACFNSIILVVQMLVLRLELLKQKAYQIIHLFFFIFLTIISVSRFLLMLFASYDDTEDIVNLALAGVLLVISGAQLGCWLAKKQSLPQFNNEIVININEQLHQQINRADVFSERIHHRAENDFFPYIVPFVSVQNGKIRIILQSYANRTRTIMQQSTSQQKQKYQSMVLSPLLKPYTFNERQKTKTSQFISVGSYDINELRQFYILCCKFPIQKKIQFDYIQLHQLVKHFQQFLEELLNQKMYYQNSILKYLKVPSNYLQYYQQIFDKNSQMNLESDIDQTIGMKLLDDKNSIYCSILMFRHLWMSDHFVFYFKVIVISTKKVSYPIKRYSEFQDLHHSLVNIIREMGKNIKLPILPKKHMFLWNVDEEINKRKIALEKYLKKICNDSTIMEVPTLRLKIFHFLQVQNDIKIQGRFQNDFYKDLKIVKGQIIKTLTKGEYVTYYQFKLFDHGIETKTITKRFSQFKELHQVNHQFSQELQRWMENIMTTYKFIALPQRVIYKSEAIRHEKLKNYLQLLAQIRDIGKVYAVNTFFNIYGNQNDNLSDISAILAHTHSTRKSVNQDVFKQVIELQEKQVLRRESNGSQSSHFSKKIEDLGNPYYD